MTTRATAPAATVLVVEDDAAIREGLVDALGFEGYRVLQAADAVAGRESALRSTCQLVLLDLMLPGGDGFDVLKEIRRLKPDLPVIVLTARGREADRVQGLRLGADDYVVKPFSVRELLARVEAVLRRSERAGSDAGDHTELAFAGVRIDLARRELVLDHGKREELTEREAALIAHLSRNRSRTVSRAELLREVWSIDPDSVQTRTVDMLVVRLRDKLGDAGPQVIVTVRGRGYMLGEPS